jgi:hypothetical protein
MIKQNNMEDTELISENIIERLKFFNYKYKQEGNSLRIYIPLRCALKINFNEDNINITSSFWKNLNLSLGAFAILTFVFLAIGIGIVLQKNIQHSSKLGGVLLIIIFPLAFILKLIITESMKAVVHNWIEKDLKKNN